MRGTGRHRHAGRLAGQKPATGAERRVSRARAHACRPGLPPCASPSPAPSVLSLHRSLLFSQEIMSDSSATPPTVARQEPDDALNLLLLVEGSLHTPPSPSPQTRRWPRQALTQNLCGPKPALTLLPAPSPGEGGSGPPPAPLPPPPARPAEPRPQQASYQDAGVGLVVVGGVHALEPLLARRVPEVCNRNTALTARGGDAQSRARGTSAAAGRAGERSAHGGASGGRGRRGPGGRRTQTGDPTRGGLGARPPPPGKTQGPPRAKLGPVPRSAHQRQTRGLAKGEAVAPPEGRPPWKATLGNTCHLPD